MTVFAGVGFERRNAPEPARPAALVAPPFGTCMTVFAGVDFERRNAPELLVSRRPDLRPVLATGLFLLRRNPQIFLTVALRGRAP
jgi:hypothetical protein